MKTEFDLQTIIKGYDTIRTLFGNEWFKENVAPFLTPPSTSPNRYKDAIPRPKHPFIEWCIEFELWREEFQKEKRIPLSPTSLQFFSLGNSLPKIQADPHLPEIVKKLKRPSEFYSTVFAIEIAESYLDKGWKAIFVPETSNRTPDLKVTRKDGSVFWVECKNLEVLSERDRRNEALWSELKSSLFPHLSAAKASYAVSIIAKRYLETKDISYLKRVISSLIEQGTYIRPSSGEKIVFEPTADETGDFEIGITELSYLKPMFSAGDFENSISSQNFDDFEYFLIEESQNVKFTTLKSFALAFRSEVKTDRLAALENALQSAVKQIPPSGPGVICIRVPNNSWGPNFEHQKTQIERVIKKEISGEQNRRINAVQVGTRYFESLEKDGIKGLGYRAFTLTIEHTNPYITYP